jgi:cbb3-type cytochrome oxidase subunit 3
MLRDYLARISLLELPVVAMVLFFLLFVAVLWRVSRKARLPVYTRMANLPLESAERPVTRPATKITKKGGL